jgi:hypothetical protein
LIIERMPCFFVEEFQISAVQPSGIGRGDARRAGY